MSKENITNYGKSIRSKLLNIAKKEDVFYQTILTRYFQERLLYRMSQTRYRNNFYLKGGALMYVYERFEARPTSWPSACWGEAGAVKGLVATFAGGLDAESGRTVGQYRSGNPQTGDGEGVACGTRHQGFSARAYQQPDFLLGGHRLEDFFNIVPTKGEVAVLRKAVDTAGEAEQSYKASSFHGYGLFYD